jgi:hypothetical protein
MTTYGESFCSGDASLKSAKSNRKRTKIDEVSMSCRLQASATGQQTTCHCASDSRPDSLFSSFLHPFFSSPSCLFIFLSSSDYYHHFSALISFSKKAKGTRTVRNLPDVGSRLKCEPTFQVYRLPEIHI